jgi:hypothetical protein
MRVVLVDPPYPVAYVHAAHSRGAPGEDLREVSRNRPGVAGNGEGVVRRGFPTTRAIISKDPTSAVVHRRLEDTCTRPRR